MIAITPSSLPVLEVSLGVFFGILAFCGLLMAMLFMAYLRRKNIMYMSISRRSYVISSYQNLAGIMFVAATITTKCLSSTIAS